MSLSNVVERRMIDPLNEIICQLLEAVADTPGEDMDEWDETIYQAIERTKRFVQLKDGIRLEDISPIFKNPDQLELDLDEQ